MLIVFLFTVAIGLLVAAYLPKLSSLKLGMGAGIGAATIPVSVQVTEPEPSNDEIRPRPLVVRELRQGMATVLIRHRPTKSGCTASLIVWSGKKKQSIKDSHFDLGLVPSAEVGEDVIGQFIAQAEVRLDELAAVGKQKRVARKVAKVEPAVVADVAEVIPAPVAVTPVAPVVEVAGVASLEVDPSVKLRRTPSVFRGMILEAGYMPRALADGEKQMYGVRYQTPEGIVDTVWGANLRNALRDAGAAVGDQVEILKVGRKTMEEGKAPMNLFQITRI
jgi:hypothetical protein